MTGWMNQENETLFDLIFGCVAYSIVVEIFGLILAPEKLYFTAGLLFGTVVAIALSISMYNKLNNCLHLTPKQAERSMIFGTLLRAVVILLAVWIGLKVRFISFPGVVIGILGLKVAAYLHAYTNVYITKKLKKGR